VSCRIYQSPGRIRVRLSILKSGISHELISELKNLDGVRSVLPSELTGSLVIYYDKNIRGSSSILRVFRRYGLLENVIAFPSRSAPVTALKDRPVSLIDLINEIIRKAIRMSPSV
jgi:hypothetical protein